MKTMKTFFKKGQKDLALPYQQNAIIVDIERVINRDVEWIYRNGKIIFPADQFTTSEYWEVRKLTRFSYV
jgi:hypothetical protein